MGILALEAGRADHAEMFMRRAIASNAGNPGYHLYLGHALHQQDRAAEAEVSYREAIRLRPDLPQAHANLGTRAAGPGAARRGDALVSPGARLATARSRGPEQPRNGLSSAGPAGRGQAPLRQALALAPLFPSALNNLGAVLRELDRPEEAEICLREAIRLAGGLCGGKANLGLVLMELDRPAEAEGVLRDALIDRPDDPATLNNLGVALSQQDRPADAEARCARRSRWRPAAPGPCAIWRRCFAHRGGFLKPKP